MRRRRWAAAAALLVAAGALWPVSAGASSESVVHSGAELQAAHDLGDIAGGSGAVFVRTRLEDADGDAASAGDWRDYCFELSADRKVGLGLRQLDRDADLFVRTAGGDELASSQAAGTASEWVQESLRAGEYCARVTAVEAGANSFVFRYGTGPADPDSLLPAQTPADTATDTAAGSAAGGVSAEFSQFPDAHDGTAFTAVLSFDPEPELSYLTLRDEALTAADAAITSASRRTPGRSDGWLVTVTPHSGHRGDVTVTLAATVSCGDQGAVCTATGDRLVTRVELTVPGPHSTRQHATQTVIRTVGEHTPRQDDDITARVQHSDKSNDKDDGQSGIGPRQAQSTDATLSALTVSPVDINGFAADVTSYEAGVASTVAQATVTATASHSGATVAITPADADTGTDGHQVALTAGRNAVRVRVTAEDGNATETYTVSVNRGVTADYGWKAADDFDSLRAAGNNAATGVWSNGTTMWVADSADESIYAYDLSSRARDATKDFNTLNAAGNDDPRGLWSDGTTMWVTDSDGKVYAYGLSSRARDATKDFNTLNAAGNQAPRGMWSDGTTMWIVDSTDSKVYAYGLSSKTRDATKDFNTLNAAGNQAAEGMWSDGTTMWVTDSVDDKIYAYDMGTKARDASKDFNTLNAAGNQAAGGMWSDGTTMWVADSVDDKVYSYNMPPSSDATLSALTVSPVDINGFAADVTSYEAGVASTVAVATVTATKNDPGAAVAITPADADTNTTGHQIALSAGRNTVTVTVTAEDGNTTETYTISINRGVTDIYGWKAVDDFDTLVAAGNDFPAGLWSDGTTMWVSDADESSSAKIFAYDAVTGARKSSEDFDTLVAAFNGAPTGLASDGTTMWVSDAPDLEIRAYDMTTKARDSGKDISSVLGGNPYGLWSDGTTLWVAIEGNDRVNAYTLATKARDSDKDFATLDAANGNPRGIWSDGVTMWVVDSGADKVFAYDMATKARNASRDFATLAAAGNDDPQSIWSDGATLWVSDTVDDKLYSYNLPPPVPAAPEDLDAEVGDGRVQLSWLDPGDATITGYQWRQSGDDGNTWGPGPVADMG